MKNRTHFNMGKVLQPHNRKVLIISFVLVILSLAIFARSINNEFVWDTHLVITEETRLESFSGALRFFSEDYLLLDATELGDKENFSQVHYYRPLLGIIHTAQHHLFGEKPWPYKATNLLLNALVTVLGFLFIHQVTKKLTFSFIASILFLTNASKAEVVYWVYSDGHIYFALFILSATIAHLNQKKLVALLCFTLASLCLETVVVTPIIFFFMSILLLNKNIKAAAIDTVPFVVITAVYLTIRTKALGSFPPAGLHFPETIYGAATILAKTLKMFFIPDAPVTAYYYEIGFFNEISIQIFISIVVSVSFMIITCILLRRDKESVFFLIWFLVFIGLFIFITFNAGQTTGGYLMSEKILYLSSLGLSVVAAKLICTIFSKHSRLALIPVLIMGLYHAQYSYARAAHWNSTIPYLEKAIEFEPRFDFFHYALTYEYNKLQHFDRALTHLEPLLRRDPNNTIIKTGMAETYFQKGISYKKQNNIEQAIESYNKSLTFIPNQPRIFNNLGNIYISQNDYQNAISNFEIALELNPEYEKPLLNLGRAYMRSGNFVQAEKYLKRYSAKKTTLIKAHQ